VTRTLKQVSKEESNKSKRQSVGLNKAISCIDNIRQALSSLSGLQEPHFMDLWKLQEKEKGLVFGEEGENVSRVSKSVGRWVCEWPS